MELRDSKWDALTRSAHVELRLRWYYDPNGPSGHELLARTLSGVTGSGGVGRPLTALEQLQANSDETNLKLGNLARVGDMLSDFPLLFDVHMFEVTRIRFSLKALFMRYATEKTAADEAIVIDELDLREKLRAPPGEDGIHLLDLCKKLVTYAILPVWSQVNLTDTAGHIVSGVAAGMFSKAGHGGGDAADEAGGKASSKY